MNKFKTELTRVSFILPALAFFAFAVIIPFIYGINISFTDWDGIAKDFDYVAFDNYKRVFEDKNVWESMRKTIYFGFLYCIANNVLALFIAILVSRKFRGSKITKTLFFIPTSLSAVLTAFIWKFIYSTYFVELTGLSNPLGSPDSVLNGIIALFVWNMVGINIIIYSATLVGIPNEYYEAARVDGASVWQQFKNITLPMLMPAFTVCITLTLTNGMKEFGIVLSSTGGGPIDASELILIYIYNNIFSYYEAGYGQAIALLFLVFLVIVGMGLSKLFRSREVEA